MNIKDIIISIILAIVIIIVVKIGFTRLELIDTYNATHDVWLN